MGCTSLPTWPDGGRWGSPGGVSVYLPGAALPTWNWSPSWVRTGDCACASAAAPFSPAHAEEVVAVDPAAKLGKRLDRWVPGSAQLTDYQGIVNGLLRLVADRQLRAAELKPAHAAIYRHLLPATALIESCWRQFVREDGKVTFLKSSAGSIGMMQINQHVWWGFYEIERL